MFSKMKLWVWTECYPETSPLPSPAFIYTSRAWAWANGTKGSTVTQKWLCECSDPGGLWSQSCLFHFPFLLYSAGLWGKAQEGRNPMLTPQSRNTGQALPGPCVCWEQSEETLTALDQLSGTCRGSYTLVSLNKAAGFPSSVWVCGTGMEITRK